MAVFVTAMTFIPSVQSVLSTTSLTNLQWIMVIGGAISASSWIEVVNGCDSEMFYNLYVGDLAIYEDCRNIN